MKTAQQLHEEITDEIKRAYPFAVAIGVGALRKQVPPRKRTMMEAMRGYRPPVEFVNVMQVLVLERTVPKERYAPNVDGDQSFQQAFFRQGAIDAATDFAKKNRIDVEWHFAPWSWMDVPVPKSTSILPRLRSKR